MQKKTSKSFIGGAWSDNGRRLKWNRTKDGNLSCSSAAGRNMPRNILETTMNGIKDSGCSKHTTEANRSCHLHNRSGIRKRQKGMSTSSMDEQVIIRLGVRLDDIPIMCDNKGAIDLSKNPVQQSRTKHIEIRHHFLRDNVQKGNISIEKVSSEDNITDILTKPLKREPFNDLRLGLGMMEHID
ncbi:hypothetical protein Tco_1430662 [Tanacetum coccineum]